MAKSDKTVNVINKGGPSGGAYFLAFIGAAAYFVQQSVGFGEFIVAILKAAAWPAFVMHRVLQLLNL